MQAYPQAQGAAPGPGDQSFTQVCKVQEALNCLLQLSVAAFNTRATAIVKVSHHAAQAPGQSCTGVC